MSVHPNLIYKFNAISINISASYFEDIDKLILKFIWRGKRLRIANTILKEKNKVRGLKLFDLKTFYTATVIKQVWYWQKNRQINEWNCTESLDMDLHKYSQLIFDKGVKGIQWRKDNLFSKWCWNN